MTGQYSYDRKWVEEREMGGVGAGKDHEAGFDLGTPEANGTISRRAAHKAIGSDFTVF